jgi:hypothetical protein
MTNRDNQLSACLQKYVNKYTQSGLPNGQKVMENEMAEFLGEIRETLPEPVAAKMSPKKSVMNQ